MAQPFTTSPTSPLAILEAEDRLTFTEAARLCDVSLVTLHRWRMRGRGLRDGTRVYLPGVTIGRRSFITRSDLDRFLQAVASDHVRLPKPQEARSNRVPEETERYLEEVGIRRTSKARKAAKTRKATKARKAAKASKAGRQTA